MSDRDNMTAMSHETTGFCFCGQMHGQVKDWNEHDWAALRTHAPIGALQLPTVELEAYLDPHDALLDQGVTRLQFLAFCRGDDSDVWNGNPERSRWVRYRGHQIDRIPTPDGHVIQLIFTDHNGAPEDATWTVGGSAYDAYAVVRMVDFIIDAVIAEYGTGLGA